MKAAVLTLLPSALLLLPLPAAAAAPAESDRRPVQGSGLLIDAPQELPDPLSAGEAPANPPSVPSDLPARETTSPVIAESTPQASATGATEAQVSPVEQHLNKGIALLLKLEQVMASVDSPESAQKAVQPIGLITAELSKWPQGFLTLPPPDEEQRIEYEDRYLPVIRRINEQIKLQGERLASAQYYGSRPLAAALVRLVLTLQQ